MCKNCGEELSTDGKGTETHKGSGKYACYPSVKPNDPRWSLMATEGNPVEFSEDDLNLRYAAI